jgi:predicted RNA-binding protein (virulence factor B family)
MLKIGHFNLLPVVKFTSAGLYVDGGEEEGEILLPNREVPPGTKVGDELNVFIYLDSEDRLIATPLKPYATVGEFAVLKVTSVGRVGAFLDWGLLKELFLPYAEQSRELRVGDKVVVYLYLDNTMRIAASMRVTKHLSKVKPEYKPGDAVDLITFAKTDLGYKAIVDGKHAGVLYADEVYQKLHYGDLLKAFIKQVRPDGKLDLMLTRAGAKAAAEDIGPQILEALKQARGFLPINDKSSAETIHAEFGVSRKKFKIALGGLYKKRLITVDDAGIHLTVSQT